MSVEENRKLLQMIGRHREAVQEGRHPGHICDMCSEVQPQGDLSPSTFTITAEPPRGSTYPNNPTGPCQNCKERPATVWWILAGGLDIHHGGGVPWCEICAIRAQIKAAQEAEKSLPGLQKKLAGLLGEAPESLTTNAKGRRHEPSE
jgi:hypothetical protein